MAEAISGELPGWLQKKASPFDGGSIVPEVQAGFNMGVGLREQQRLDEAVAMRREAWRIAMEEKQRVTEGTVKVAQILSKMGTDGYDDPALQSEFWGTVAQIPQFQNTPMFKNIMEGFQNSAKAKANERLWSERLKTQRDIADTRAQGQLDALQKRLDFMLQMEGVKQEHRKEIEGIKADMKILVDSMKPTRPGEVFHDLSESDTINQRSDLDALNRQYQNEGWTPEEFERRREVIKKKYDAKRIARPSAPATQTQKAPSKRVKVKSPDGKLFTLPAEQLKDALDQGYEQVP